MALLLKNAHVVDPAVELDGCVDVLVEGDKIAAVGENLTCDAAEVIDLTGKYLVPGLVDMHVHLREPGFEAKGDIESETAAPRTVTSPAVLHAQHQARDRQRRRGRVHQVRRRRQGPLPRVPLRCHDEGPQGRDYLRDGRYGRARLRGLHR